MAFILGLLGRKYLTYILAFAVLAGAVLWLRYDAVQDDRAKAESERLRQHSETIERINDAISDTRTPDDIRERLRQLAQ